MRLLMMGTGPFAVPTLEALYHTEHELAAVVTQHARDGARKPASPVSPVRQLAAERNTPLLDPMDVNAAEARRDLARFEADLLVVADYGQILSNETLGVARLGGINLHASLLPKYRGAAPVNWAIYHGETETGVTVIHMTPHLDAGPCLAQRKVTVGHDETADELEARLAALGAPVVCEVIAALAEGTAREIPQNPAQTSRARRLRKSDGAIDWARPAEAIRNQIRALEPWPRCYTFWRRPGGQPLRLIVRRLIARNEETGQAPGTVVEAEGARLSVATGRGTAQLAEIQPAGKRALDAEAFLRGYHVEPGQRLGTAAAS